MPKNERQKLKLLYLQEYLRQNTDENHPVSVQTLSEHLAAKGIPAERKSIYRDLRALSEFGMEIHYRRGKNGGYYVSQRDFALSELKLLVDAVLSSRFLSSAQSVQLIRKLAALSSAHEAELLRREVVVAGRLKSGGEESFRNVDILHDAIEQNRQVVFRYFDWGVDRKKHLRAGQYFASPYALCWDDENYYLIAHSEKHGLTHYRVDKMTELFLTEQPRVFSEEFKKFNPASYTKAVFGMFRGNVQRIKLRFENTLAGVVIDRFGQDVLLVPDGAEHFTFTAEISVSPNFLGWVASLGGRAAIVFPSSAVEEYRSFCHKALNALPPEE